jgi:hypothetical protein
MPNHVHLLITPRLQVRKITRGIKGTTARGANEILGRAGQQFWQDESFDHWVRDEGQFWRLKQYIERNPVKAKLVRKPEDWPWSSAAAQFYGTGTLACALFWGGGSKDKELLARAKNDAFRADGPAGFVHRKCDGVYVLHALAHPLAIRVQ